MLALALGFLFAAIAMRSIGLVIPAVIIGLNGVVFQFCALTGLWEAWSVLWTIEPLSVGLALLLVGAKTRSAGPSIAGLIFCALAGMGLILMTLVLADWWLFGAVGAAALIGVGCLLTAWAVVMAYPLIWMLITSLKKDAELYRSPYALPAVFRWDNYAAAG